MAAALFRYFFDQFGPYAGVVLILFFIGLKSYTKKKYKTTKLQKQSKKELKEYLEKL